MCYLLLSITLCSTCVILSMMAPYARVIMCMQRRNRQGLTWRTSKRDTCVILWLLCDRIGRLLQSKSTPRTINWISVTDNLYSNSNHRHILYNYNTQLNIAACLRVQLVAANTTVTREKLVSLMMGLVHTHRTSIIFSSIEPITNASCCD